METPAEPTTLPSVSAVVRALQERTRELLRLTEDQEADALLRWQLVETYHDRQLAPALAIAGVTFAWDDPRRSPLFTCDYGSDEEQAPPLLRAYREGLEAFAAALERIAAILADN